MMKLTKGQYGYYYACPCGQTHGCHQATGIPLGIPADKETRQLRIRAHELFKIWFERLGIKRREAYRKLGLMMDLNRENTHIGLMNKKQCGNLIIYFEARLNNGEGNLSN